MTMTNEIFRNFYFPTAAHSFRLLKLHQKEELKLTRATQFSINKVFFNKGFSEAGTITVHCKFLLPSKDHRTLKNLLLVTQSAAEQSY